MDNKEISAPCERAQDLVAYLYGEASEREALDFESHMERCDACSDELAAFTRVHEDVVEWRNQSLPSFEPARAANPLFHEAPAAPQSRSALAAIRQFFTLSPVWMRAATAAAAMIICALAVFTAIHFYQRPETVVRVVPSGPTQAEIQAMVEKRAEELRRKEKQESMASAQTEKQTIPRVKDNPPVALTPRRTPLRPSQTVARGGGGGGSQNKVNATSEARQQLAELVRESRDDDGLPRLSDLIEDSNDSN